MFQNMSILILLDTLAPSELIFRYSPGVARMQIFYKFFFLVLLRRAINNTLNFLKCTCQQCDLFSL